MPFVQRVVDPIYLSRRSLRDEDGEPLVADYELEAVTNNTLSSALRQLASLVLIANDIFQDLTKQLEDVGERSRKLRSRIDAVEEKVVRFDPRKVTVPESDICAFSQREVHYQSPPLEACSARLFGADSRPECVRRLYAAAARTPVPAMRQLDRYRRDGHRSSRYFMCTPVLGGARRKIRTTDIDIETRKPAALDELRRWTSLEAFGDVTVAPDCASRIAPSPEPAEETDHKLPSPEEQVQTVALRFPSEVVPVDISGRAFDRMSLLRRSLIHVEVDESGTVRRRGGRGRKTRGKRRNTIAGTDQKELRQAVAGEVTTAADEINSPDAITALDSLPVIRSNSSDLLRNKDESPPDKKSHFNSLRQWGKVKLRLIRSASSDKGVSSLEEVNIYEAVTAKGKRSDLKHDRKTATSNLPISSSSGPMSMAVKLRENSLLRRKKKEIVEDAVHSSSGNWSASSESGRASIGSENTTATSHHPKSTTATLSSADTSSNSLNHHHNPPSSSSVGSRRKFANTSASSSFSEGTLTPDLVMPFPDDGETSSVYSCDTEGYYTSFHMDSGLKTLKEEDPGSVMPQMPLHSTSALSGSPGRSNTLTAENEYELFGKGSTSTTTSSAGTVCTTLMVGNESNLSLPSGPAVPERKSSLENKSSLERNNGINSQMVTVIVHEQKREGVTSDSPDSGHNTSSSPVGSTNSPPGTLTGRSSEYEFSESDLEGVDRIERIRVKTTINSSRIPSMCVITPPQSDDETSLNHFVPLYKIPMKVSSVPSNKTDSYNVTNKLADQNKPQHKSSPRRFEKQVSTDSDRSSENECAKVTSNSRTFPSKRNSLPRSDKTAGHTSVKKDSSSPSKSRSRETVLLNNENKKPVQRKVSPSQQLRHSLQPLNTMFDKVKGALISTSNKKSKTFTDESSTTSKEKVNTADAGDYVTIADIRGNNVSRYQGATPPSNYPSHYSNNTVKASPSAVTPKTLIHDTEYVSLNELPSSHISTHPANILVSPSDSLERKKRQGARVTLDSEGKVVYSSDSLKRKKGGHTTFEPGPYVKDPITTPVASPLSTHRVPKSNIRPVSTANQRRDPPLTVKPLSNKPLSPNAGHKSPTSPQLGKVIIRAGNKTSSVSRVASPTPIMVVPSIRPTSPRQNARGAYVNVQSPDEFRHRSGQSTPSTSPTEDEEGKLSTYDTRQMAPRYTSPPNCVSPNQMQDHNIPWAPPINQRPGCASSPPNYWTLPVRRPSEVQAGYSVPMNGSGDHYLNRSGSGRYNTIANTGTRGQYSKISHAQNMLPLSHSAYDPRERILPVNYETMPQNNIIGHPNSNEHSQNYGYYSNTKVNPQNQIYYPNAQQNHISYSNKQQQILMSNANSNLPLQNHKPFPDIRIHQQNQSVRPQFQNQPQAQGRYPNSNVPNRQYGQPIPASIPNVPRNLVVNSDNPSVQCGGTYYSQVPTRPNLTNTGQRFFSSTPNKDEQTERHHTRSSNSLDFSTTLSPIQKISDQQMERRNMLQQTISADSKPNPNNQQPTNSRQIEEARENTMTKPGMTKLLSPPKTTMTAEEIFAAIHKSKKRLNIKSDMDSVSRSTSPSCSSMTSVSPVSSETSLNGGKRVINNIAENGGRSRHSWSPNNNSGEYYDFYRHYENKSPSPNTSPGSRQSWSSERLGPRQQTSRNDFKRLLLQHGSKSNPSHTLGSSNGRISAVEQLKLSRQQKLNKQTNGHLPRSPAEKRTNGSKLLTSPRSLANWRFSSPRTDVLSSTILEDCAEEENVSSSPENKVSKLTTTNNSHNHTLSNTTVRRPLNFSSSEANGKVSPVSNIQKQKPITVLENYTTEPTVRKGYQPSQYSSTLKSPINGTTTSQNNHIHSPTHSNKTFTQELLSPSNVKENFNINQQLSNNSINNTSGNRISNKSVSFASPEQQLVGFKNARQTVSPQIMNEQNYLLLSPSPRINALMTKTRSFHYGTNNRSILGAIDTKVSPKTTLETAL